MVRRSWKRSEGAIAALLGGERVPVPGRAGPDIAHARLSPEVKSRSTLPGYLRDWVDQAVKGAEEGKVPLVVIHEAGRRHASDLALLRLTDLVTLLSEGNHLEEVKECQEKSTKR